jgi:hypothetical protein
VCVCPAQWSIRVEPRQKTYGDKDIYDLFDKQQSLSREQRQIFTGNVVRAYEQFKGKPVNFKDAQGNVRQGLLMSQGFDIRETLEESPVKLPSVEDCNRFFSATNNRVSLKTADENLYVKPLNNGEIQLGAERSKAISTEKSTN